MLGLLGQGISAITKTRYKGLAKDTAGCCYTTEEYFVVGEDSPEVVIQRSQNLFSEKS